MILILFGILICVAMVVCLVLIADSFFGGCDFATQRRAIKVLSVVIKKYKSGFGRFYDLGCARGNLALSVKKNCPGLEVFAFDNSALRIFIARCRAALLHRRIFFQKQDFFQANISQADIVFAYLDQSLLPALEQKLLKELKSGALAIVNGHPFPCRQPDNIFITSPKHPDFQKLFVYVKKV